MTDVLTSEQRSRCMAAIRGKDTRPELLVRKLLHSLGYRYCLHRSDLPGKPDLVFVRLRKVIFVHGCFWHRHNCKLGRPIPATRREFWLNKLEGNKKRDRKNRRLLKNNDWEVLTVWECQTKSKVLTRTIARIVEFLED
ncbi:MAG: very short patch repair endonuclease [Planctomycetaceae bacterium]